MDLKFIEHAKELVEIKDESNPYDFENDLLEQAKLMESIRISSHEKRLVSLSEIK